MTGTPEPADPADGDLASPHRVVLDDDGLDRLELVLGGWLPSSALSVRPEPGEELVLTDAENTPLAQVSGGSTVHDLPDVLPLQPLARGSGPQWDPAVRLSAEEVRARIAGQREVSAYVVDQLPTRFDAAAAHARFSVVIVGVRRGRRPNDGVGWAGMTRAGWAVADAVDADSTGPRVLRIVVPWPTERPPDLRRAGIDAWEAVSAFHEGTDQAVPAIDRLREDEIDLHYPPASAFEIRRARRADAGPGAVVFFTGLSGSGKSTIARALADELADEGPRRVTLLDGDEVRQHLSRGLGFDAESRAINIDRIAWVASLVAEHGGIAIAAPIAPFDAGRRNARALAEGHGAFLLVWVDTPLAVCEARDRKGLYARARAGEVAEFTGISSPYEPPADADVVIDTTRVDVPEAVRRIREALDARLSAI